MSVTESVGGALLARRDTHIPRGVANLHPIFAARAEGAKLWDVDGKEYLDFVGGIGVMNVGHNHPRIVRAVEAQLARFSHTCFQVAMYEPYIELAERLNALIATGSGEMKTLFLTTGAEATENAVKISRAYTNRPAIVAFTGGFHGRTLLGMTLTAAGHSYRQNFGPFAPDIYHSPFPYEYRGWTADKALDALQELFDTRVPVDRVAAVIFEPQLGEGGFVPAPPAFVTAIREITARHGIVLIADEIQTGFGRTGRMFAYQHYGIEPDLVMMAKSLAAGLPLSAVVGKAEIMDAPAPGGLGGTYAGNPLACAAGLAVLDVFDDERLLDRAERLGSRIGTHLRTLQQRFPQIGDVRGLGAMQAIEIVKDAATKEPDAALAQRVVDAARERGLLVIRCGPMKNVIRVLVPLTVAADDLDRGFTILADAFTAVAQPLP
jgi:4-aminobutyrate aminotransferase/(S)-3-amino-2-methylpropionate transaminase